MIPSMSHLDRVPLAVLPSIAIHAQNELRQLNRKYLAVTKSRDFVHLYFEFLQKRFGEENFNNLKNRVISLYPAPRSSIGLDSAKLLEEMTKDLFRRALDIAGGRAYLTALPAKVAVSYTTFIELAYWIQDQEDEAFLESLPTEFTKAVTERLPESKRNLNWRATVCRLAITEDMVGESLTFKSTKLIPKEFCRFSRLRTLDSRGGPIEAIPQEIGNLTNLETLRITHGTIRSLPIEMRNLTNLRWLCLNGNRISHIPDWIDGLPVLEKIYLMYNLIKTLPTWLSHEETLEATRAPRIIYLTDNPIVGPLSLETWTEGKGSNEERMGYGLYLMKNPVTQLRPKQPRYVLASENDLSSFTSSKCIIS